MASWLLCLAVVSSALAVNFDFTLRFTGSCTRANNVDTCVARAHSQNIHVQFTPGYESLLNVQVDEGNKNGFVEWVSVAQVGEANAISESGNITFGTAAIRQEALFYSSFGSSGRALALDANSMAFSLNGEITGGLGKLQNAKGIISFSGRGALDMSHMTAYLSVVCEIERPASTDL